MATYKKVLGMVGAAAFVAAAAFSAAAQDEGGGAPAVEVKPRPAERMALTQKSLLLDVVYTGERFVAVGDRGGIILSPDGQTWEQVDVPVRAALTAVTFADKDHGWAVGHDAAIVGTADGGKTWSKLKSPYDSSYFGALPVGANGAVVYGLSGNAYLTQDVRGGRWTRLQTDSVASMFGGTVLPDGELAMVGLNGVIFIADASGKVRSLQSPTGTPLASAIPLNGGLLAVGESGVQVLASLK